MISDRDRRELFTALEQALGERPAASMMELLPPVGWADVARRSDLVAVRGEMAELRGELRGEMAELRGEMAELRAELKGEMAELRVELKGEMAELRVELKGEMAELRGEIGQLDGRITAQLPKLIAANAASVIAVAGLVLAAVRLG